MPFSHRLVRWLLSLLALSYSFWRYCSPSIQLAMSFW